MNKKELKFLMKIIVFFAIGFILFIIGIQYKNDFGAISSVIGIFVVLITFFVIFYKALVSEE